MKYQEQFILICFVKVDPKNHKHIHIVEIINQQNLKRSWTLCIFERENIYFIKTKLQALKNILHVNI